MSCMKSVGGKIIVTSVANQELITWETCGVRNPSNVVLGGFYIRNEGIKDIFIKINGGSELLLKPSELFDLSGLTSIESCIVVTNGAMVRWGGLR